MNLRKHREKAIEAFLAPDLSLHRPAQLKENRKKVIEAFTELLDERIQREEAESVTQSSMKAVFCIHCGRVYIIDDKHGRDECACGSKLHLVAKEVSLGEELKLADNHEARVIGQALTDKCDVCGISDHGNPTGWGIRGTTLHCPQCLARLERRGAPLVSFIRR